MTSFLRDSWNRSSASCRVRPRVLSAALFLVLMIPVAAAAQLLPASSGPLRPGDIVVVTNLQPPGSETSPGVLLKIDPSTGIRTTLSDFADPSQGPIGRPSSGSSAVVVEDSTAVFVAHSLFGTNGRGALLNVDPSTGLRRILSDFGDVSQGPPAGAGQLAIEPSGDFLLFNGPALIRVSGITGIREMVSDFQNPAQGPIVGSAITFGSRITVGESGQIVISGVGSNGEHALFSVDRTNGVRSLLSDFGDPTQGLSGAVFDLTVDFSGDFLVTVHIDAPRIMDQY